MTPTSIVQEIREALEGRPGQPLVFGVCRTLARRWGREAWKIRLAVLALALFWTLPVLAAYVIAGFALPETEPRTRGFFAGLGVIAREAVAKACAALGGMFDGSAASRHGRGC